MVTLRAVTEDDLLVLFEHQRDPVSVKMAAVASRERDAFLTHWRTKVLIPANTSRAIVVDGVVVGHIGAWTNADGARDTGYWLERSQWGKGIATEALRSFLEVEKLRPLHAVVAQHNLGSLRVLEKCGFRRVGDPERSPDDGVVILHLRLDPA